MKRNYIIPNTTAFSFCTAYLCNSAVGSVQGGTLNFGGEQETIDPN